MGERWLREFGVGLPPPEPFGTARPIVAKHERAHEMFYLDRVKPGFSRDLEGRAPNQDFAIECNRLLTGFSAKHTREIR